MSRDEDFRDGDETLIRRTATGHRSAFDAFVERHQAAVYRFARTLAAGEEAAEEAVRAAFVAAWRSAGRFQGEASVRTWLFTLVRQAVERQPGRQPEESGDSRPLHEIGQAAGWGAGGDRLANRLADRTLLRRALAALSPADRALLILRDLEGLPTSDSAEVLRQGEAALRTRLHRARLRLLAHLREEAGDGG